MYGPHHGFSCTTAASRLAVEVNSASQVFALSEATAVVAPEHTVTMCPPSLHDTGAPRETEAGPADAGPEDDGSAAATIPQVDGAWDCSPSESDGLEASEAPCCWDSWHEVHAPELCVSSFVVEYWHA